MCKLNSWSLGETISPAATTACFSFCVGFFCLGSEWSWIAAGSGSSRGKECLPLRGQWPARFPRRKGNEAVPFRKVRREAREHLFSATDGLQIFLCGLSFDLSGSEPAQVHCHLLVGN